MSPHAVPEESSPLISPPSTPVAAVITEEQPASALRRRTISQSRWVKEKEKEENRCPTPEVEVQPYEKRAFPLSGEEYERMLKVGDFVCGNRGITLSMNFDCFATGVMT